MTVNEPPKKRPLEYTVAFNMYLSFLHFLVLFLLVLSSTAYTIQHQYIVKFENATVITLDKHFAHITLKLNLYNDTVNTIDMMQMFKFPVDETVTIGVQCFRITKSNKKYPVFHYTKLFKDVLEMEAFDISTLYLEQTRPQLIWPPKKNVKYETLGWAPNSVKYPIINIPSGKCGATVSWGFKNGTNFATADWVVNIFSR